MKMVGMNGQPSHAFVGQSHPMFHDRMEAWAHVSMGTVINPEDSSYLLPCNKLPQNLAA